MEKDHKAGDDPAKTGDGALETLAWALHAVVKNWPIILSLTLLSIGCAFAYVKSVPKTYEAATLIEFDPDVIKPLGNKTDPLVGWTAIWDTKEYYETQYRIIQSDHVLSMVARDLNLQNDSEFLGYKPSGPAPLESVVDALRARLKVDPAKGSRLVYIKMQDTRPAQARRLSEAVTKAYIAQNLEKMISATGDTVVWLTNQLDHFKHELEATEDSLHEFKKENDLPSSTIEDLSKEIRMEMDEYDTALTHTRLRRQEFTARNHELSKVDTQNPDQIPASELLSNAFLSQLRKQYQDATRERVELIAEGKGENHPAVHKADEKIAIARDQLLAEIKTIQGAVARDLAIIQEQESGEARLYEGTRKRAVELNLKELEFHRLDRMRAQNEKVYGVLLEQLKEADLRRMMNTNNIQLIDVPNLPKSPISPNVPMDLAIGLGIGLALGIALSLVRESLDNTMKTPEDVEKRLKLTFLGLLPEFGDDDKKPKNADEEKRRRRWRRPRGESKLPPELVVHEDPSSGIAEAARALRTNLMFMNPDRPYKRLLVTSSVPSEGKTTVAVTVAISLAQSGQKVCIIDCDLRRPRLHRVFNRVGDVGLMNLIVGEIGYEEAAKPTIVPNLYSIPCGPLPPSPADVVSSAKFREVLDELGRRFDRIVLDSPPLVAVTDSAILSTIVDGVLLVIRAFKTTVGMAKTGLRQLEDVDAPIAGTVLNAVDLQRNQYYYEGYYYYRREGYAANPSEIKLNPPPDEATHSQQPPAN